MPSCHRALSRATVAQTIESALAGDCRQLVGVEVEYPVHHVSGPSIRAQLDELRAVCEEPFPSDSRATIEPGGQMELSTAPAATLDGALDALHADAGALQQRLRRRQMVMRDIAVDTRRPPRRILEAPRYAAMEQFFGASGEAGTWMMCNTASVQLNISNHPVHPQFRWALAHRLGPVLVAAFANSPGFDASGVRWQSLRQAIWWSIDPSRTRPPCTKRPMAEAWLDYALAADVMLIRSEDGGEAAAQRPGLSFEQWMATGHELGWPTVDDLRYHLTTLFPPVRPRGWLELRMIDALPPRLLEAAALVTTTALTVEAAAEELWMRLAPVDDLWAEAARYGLAHPVLAAGANLLFDVVCRHLDQRTASSSRKDAVLDFRDRQVRRGMSPAQEVSRLALLRGHEPDLSAPLSSPELRTA